MRLTGRRVSESRRRAASTRSRSTARVLRVAADLRGAEVAQAIQLSLAYAPEPPFSSGTPELALPAVLERVRLSYRAVTKQREQTATAVGA